MMRLTWRLAVFAASSIALSGCLWIAIPSLAYEGYKYEKTGEYPGKAQIDAARQPERAKPAPTPQLE
jgi:hypothetical protein